jgi:hypothetical protein
MSPEELEKLEGELRKEFPHSRAVEVRKTGQGEYEITMVDAPSSLLKRIDRHTELK